MQSSIDIIAHIIQIALTPIFLLVGIAGLLNVFSTRHSYVTQHVDQALAAIEARDVVDLDELHRTLRILRLRSALLDFAVVMGVLSGCLTCLAAMVLFLSEINEETTQSLLFGVFGGALSCTVAALAIFSVEMVMSGSVQRTKIHWAANRIEAKKARTIP